VERQADLARREEKKENQKAKRKKKLLNANQMSSKQWLAKHGLRAKRLTILDALGSTFVTHTPKYVSILDKNVMSKVFDDVLPIAHVSRDQKIRLVNPNGVNLKDYEAKLTVAIEKFKVRLNTIVWSHLSAEDKEKLESTTPVDYEDNRSAIEAMLDGAEWSTRTQDIQMLRGEIARGGKFLMQSQALRKAAAGNDDDLEEELDDYKDDDDPPSLRDNVSPSPSPPRSGRPRSVSSNRSADKSYSRSRSVSGSRSRSPAHSPSPRHSPAASPARETSKSPVGSPPRSEVSSHPGNPTDDFY